METVSQNLLTLYRHMVSARIVDEIEEKYTQTGEAPFHVSGAGHESTAALAFHLHDGDWLHCHYRDKALMLARGVSPASFFQSLFHRDDPHSRGRQMNAHMSCRSLNVLSIVGPVGNNALQAVGIAEVVREREGQPIVYCGFGDGTAQQGEVLEAIGQASRERLPVLFVVQDNEYAISTRTAGKTFYRMGHEEPGSFYGVPIVHGNGADATECYGLFEDVVLEMRKTRLPRVVVLHVPRLASHTNADQQEVYRSANEIEEAQTLDPLPRLEKYLVLQGVSSEELQRIWKDDRVDLAGVAEAAKAGPKPQPCFTAKCPLPEGNDEERPKDIAYGSGDGFTMVKAIGEVLRHHLESDVRVTLFGEDIEDPKGDVFGVTRGLSDRFPGQVQNSPLSESTIVGRAIGQALAGGRPVAMLQFADFLPLALNQIANELACMYWRTDGQWRAPVIVMAPCGGYRAGLGHFHAQTLEALVLHTPGIDVLIPSNAVDAAGLLNAAFGSGRPAVFLYPKNLLNSRRITLSEKPQDVHVPIGKARIARAGRHITLVGWGNTAPLCEQVADTLADTGVTAEVIDLRSLSPWDSKTVLASVEKTGKLVVAHEDNRTCGFAAEIMATIAEASSHRVQMVRVTRPDTFIPCNFDNQRAVLPSYESILEQATELMGINLEWRVDAQAESSLFWVNARGNSPADESFTVIEVLVGPGDRVSPGDALVTGEADKAVVDVSSPVAGTVQTVCVSEGDILCVGGKLLSLKDHTGGCTQDEAQSGRYPVLSRPRSRKRAIARSSTGGDATKHPVYVVGVAAQPGSQIVPNESLLSRIPGWTSDDVIKRMGICRRHWIGDDETPFSLAMAACRAVLGRTSVSPIDLSALICCTSTPIQGSPSLACKLLTSLNAGQECSRMAAFDISAACTGYLYGLQLAYDALQQSPESSVLLVTVEVMSPLLNLDDEGTAFIFGDAATATILSTNTDSGSDAAVLMRPLLSAKGDTKNTLFVPLTSSGQHIQMDGVEVARVANKSMSRVLEEVCSSEGITPSDLDLVIPHQANKRILQSVRRNLFLDEEKVFSNIEDYGNTSSSSIPICLEKVLGNTAADKRIGLVAFGAGFTFGAAILETI